MLKNQKLHLYTKKKKKCFTTIVKYLTFYAKMLKTEMLF